MISVKEGSIVILPSGPTTVPRPRKVAQASALQLPWTRPCAAVGAQQSQPCCRGWRVAGERGSACAAHKRPCSRPGGTRTAAKPTELNPGFCKPFKLLSLRALKPPGPIPLLIQLLFPRLSRQLERLPEAAACAFAQRGPRGEPRVPRGAGMVALPMAAPGLRPPLPAQKCPSFFLGWAREGLALGSASNPRAVLNERLLTSEPGRVRGGRGRVHENFPPSGTTLLIEQIWLLTASS